MDGMGAWNVYNMTSVAFYEIILELIETYVYKVPVNVCKPIPEDFSFL